MSVTGADSIPGSVQSSAEGRWPARILYVDDSDPDVILAIVAFRRATCRAEITRVHNGKEALEFLASALPEAMPHLMVLDLNMPVMDGRELLAALHGSPWSSLPVIVLTASTAQSDIAACTGLGAHGFVTKPVGLQEYVDTAQLILGIWLTLSHVGPLRLAGDRASSPRASASPAGDDQR